MGSWLRVKNSTDPEALAGFIREFPSGSASELAASRMNRMLAAMAAREQQKLATAAQSAAVSAMELAAMEEAARKRAAEAEAKRVAAAQAEQERVQLAKAQAERDEAQAAQLAALAAARVQAAQLAAERSRLAEQEAQRIALAQAEEARKAVAMSEAEAAAAAIRRETERQQALAMAATQEEQARLSQAQAVAAQKELASMQAQKEQHASQELERLARAAKEALALTLAAEQQMREASLLAAQQAAMQVASVAVAAVPAVLPATPYFKGFAEHQRNYQVGDEYALRVIDQSKNTTTPLVMKVTQVDLDAERVEYNNGEFVSDLMGNTTTNQRGVFSTPRQFYPADLFVGKKWTTRFVQSRPNNVKYTFEYKLKVVARETITVPAGTFEAFKIEARGFNMNLGAYLERNIWVAPGVNADIAHEIKVRLRSGWVEQNDRQELVSVARANR